MMSPMYPTDERNPYLYAPQETPVRHRRRTHAHPAAHHRPAHHQPAHHAPSHVAPHHRPQADEVQLSRSAQRPAGHTGRAHGTRVQEGSRYAAPSDHAPTSGAGQQIVNAALQYQGQPYRWGAGHGGGLRRPGPVDCSGLVNQALRAAGIHLSGTTHTLFHVGRPVSRHELTPGSLIFFDTRGRGSHSHVGIYMGNGQFIQAPRRGDVVKISSLNDPYYASHFAGGRLLTNA